jgi:hypothetical protein
MDSGMAEKVFSIQFEVFSEPVERLPGGHRHKLNTEYFKLNTLRSKKFRPAETQRRA